MRITNTVTPVLVLGAEKHGSLGIIRSLGELGIAVYGTYSGRPGPATYSRFCRGTFCWDFPHNGAEESVHELIAIGRHIGCPTILIPTWDSTAVLLSEHYSLLANWFIFPRQPAGLAQALVSKKEMHLLAKKCGIPTPEAIFPASMTDVEQYACNRRFPVLLKGIDGNLLKKRTGKKMAIVETPEELLRQYSEMEDSAFPNLMLQEYIPGGPQHSWMFNGYFNERSECMVGFTGMKLRQIPVYTGMTSLGICAANPLIEQRTAAWMKQLGYRGILDIGYRYDARDGEYKVLDANPRVGATFRLFVGHTGLDVARALYLDMTGQPIPASQLQEGRKWMVELDFKSSFDYYRDGKLTLWAWLRSLRGIAEYGYFRKDDLRPVAKFLLAALRKMKSPLRSQVRRLLASLLPRRMQSVVPAPASGRTPLI